MFFLSPVVIKPPEARKTVAEAASISLQSKNKTSSSAAPVTVNTIQILSLAVYLNGCFLIRMFSYLIAARCGDS